MQLDLQFDSAITPREAFERFHAANPEIYDLLVKYARELRAARRRRGGIRMIWERMRWDLAIQTQGDSFKLNDHYTSFYARLIMRQEPDLDGFFSTRGEL